MAAQLFSHMVEQNNLLEQKGDATWRRTSTAIAGRRRRTKKHHKKQLLPCSFRAVHEHSVEAWEKPVHPEFLPAGVG
jgi:hypothetical protein